jgi:hypothetical protein
MYARRLASFFHLIKLKVRGRGVREITDEDRADAAAFPFDEAAEMKGLGALGPHGEAGYTTLERRHELLLLLALLRACMSLLCQPPPRSKKCLERALSGPQKQNCHSGDRGL